MRIRDSVVVVTGASGGIGRATALAFARRHAVVVLAARREAALNEVAEECRSHGATATPVVTEVADSESVDALAQYVLDRYGRIDVWVNNAALTGFAPFTEMPLDDFRRIVDVNLMGYVHGARSVLPHFREQGSGVLINVSSVVAVVPQPYTHAYGMTKAAVRALSTSLRQELQIGGANGVRVCSVLPAAIDTPLFEHSANYTGRRILAMPLVYSPERVASAIVGLVRRPRREVIVGPAGRALVSQAKTAPGLAERMMARQVERSHLSRTEPAPITSGNLYQPAPGSGAVHGQWHGRRQTALRRIAVAALTTGAVIAIVRRRRR
ncbi:SDR family oxidoreductase [Allosalinactinospora lopnorensis]|uniref:SDR family oxidoreductase n=1 Tax=Allosalinactinospora lopnorensis TaxID=1352348 RepID=UPI000623BB55|nr:SDR family oxidoreductase [Allosalinactinospora lopnorensis]